MRVKPVNESHKRIIEQAGAVYVPGMFGQLVLFNSAQTGSTLALPESELTVEAVIRHVQESNAKFGIDSNQSTIDTKSIKA